MVILGFVGWVYPPTIRAARQIGGRVRPPYNRSVSSNMRIFQAINFGLMFLVLGFAFGTQAENRPDRPQIAAAQDEAVVHLREQIERTSLTSRLTVGEFLRRTGATDDLTHALARAEIRGGPRWVDADTCQIQLDISGQRVAHILQQIAATHTKESPLTGTEVARETENWQWRTFSGTGTSTAFGRVAKMHGQGMSGAWTTVSDADRQKTLASAKADAISRVVDSIKPIPLAKGKTVGDALANKEVYHALSDWLENRPVIRVEYRRDLQVELSMAGTPGGCFGVVREAVVRYTDLPTPSTEAGWAEVRTDFEKQMSSPVGHATAPGSISPPPIARARVILPATAPDWVGRKLDAEGIADSGSSKLKAAREAEGIARHQLAADLRKLPFPGGSTLGKLIDQDARLNEAVDRSVDRASTKTDYNHRKGVSVIVQLDLRDVWDALRAAD